MYENNNIGVICINNSNNMKINNYYGDINGVINLNYMVYSENYIIIPFFVIYEAIDKNDINKINSEVYLVSDSSKYFSFYLYDSNQEIYESLDLKFVFSFDKITYIKNFIYNYIDKIQIDYNDEKFGFESYDKFALLKRTFKVKRNNISGNNSAINNMNNLNNYNNLNNLNNNNNIVKSSVKNSYYEVDSKIILKQENFKDINELIYKGLEVISVNSSFSFLSFKHFDKSLAVGHVSNLSSSGLILLDIRALSNSTFSQIYIKKSNKVFVNIGFQLPLLVTKIGIIPMVFAFNSKDLIEYINKHLMDNITLHSNLGILNSIENKCSNYNYLEKRINDVESLEKNIFFIESSSSL